MPSGASEVQEKVLDTVKDQDVGVYAVWLPVLGIDSKASLAMATKRLTDPRVRQYWDGKAELGDAFFSDSKSGWRSLGRLPCL